jgi:hypothetical protein
MQLKPTRPNVQLQNRSLGRSCKAVEWPPTALNNALAIAAFDWDVPALAAQAYVSLLFSMRVVQRLGMQAGI